MHLEMTDPQVFGYLEHDEARVLWGAASALPKDSLIVEVGSFCGKSLRWLSAGAMASQSWVVAIDSFEGDLPGEDEALPGIPAMRAMVGEQDTEAILRHNLYTSFGYTRDLFERVNIIRGSSAEVARRFTEPIDLLFLDANHRQASQDVESWLPALAPHALLALHDVTRTGMYGINGPTNTMMDLIQKGWRLYVGIGRLGCFTRDPEWWATREEATLDYYSTGRLAEPHRRGFRGPGERGDGGVGVDSHPPAVSQRPPAEGDGDDHGGVTEGGDHAEGEPEAETAG